LIPTLEPEQQTAQKPLLCDKRQSGIVLGVCPRTIDNLIKAGHLKPVKIFRRTLIRYADLLALVRKGGAQ
jgi:hypothetical protein